MQHLNMNLPSSVAAVVTDSSFSNHNLIFIFTVKIINLVVQTTSQISDLKPFEHVTINRLFKIFETA